MFSIILVIEKSLGLRRAHRGYLGNISFMFEVIMSKAWVLLPLQVTILWNKKCARALHGWVLYESLVLRHKVKIQGGNYRHFYVLTKIYR